MTRKQLALAVLGLLILTKTDLAGAASVPAVVASGRPRFAPVNLGILRMLRTLKEGNQVPLRRLESATIGPGKTMVLPVQNMTAPPASRIYLGVHDADQPDDHRILQMSQKGANVLRELVARGDIAGAHALLEQTFEAKYMLGDISLGVAGLLVPVEPGTFMMGRPLADRDQWVNEYRHEVTITTRRLVGVTKVTRGLYKKVMGSDPSGSEQSDRTPVTNVSWGDGVKLFNEMSSREGLRPAYIGLVQDWQGNVIDAKPNGSSIYRTEGYQDGLAGYRHETDAEKEQRYLAGLFGNKAPNLDDMAWYIENSGGTTHPVATKKADALGIFDSFGNVWEWAHDRYRIDLYGPVIDPEGPVTGLSHVFRGGSFNSVARRLRSSDRYHGVSGYRAGGVGLRPVRSIP